MPSVPFAIQRETDSGRGWTYLIRIGKQGSDEAFGVTLTLSWADHDHWSGGTRPPSAVVESLLELVLGEMDPAELPPKFDATTCRKWVEGLDEKMIGRMG